MTFRISPLVPAKRQCGLSIGPNGTIAVHGFGEKDEFVKLGGSKRGVFVRIPSDFQTVRFDPHGNLDGVRRTDGHGTVKSRYGNTIIIDK